MRLLTIRKCRQRYGSEEHFLRVAKGAAANGWEVHAVFPTTDETQTMIQDCAEHGIYYHPWKGFLEHTSPKLYYSLFVKALSLLPSTYRLMRIIQTVRPDVIQITLAAIFETPLFPLVSGILKIPSLVVFQVASEKLPVPDPLKNFYAWGRAKNQQWIAVSKQNRKNLSEMFSLHEENISLIHNGIELTSKFSELFPSQIQQLRREVRTELSIPENAPILLTVGRLSKDKGHIDLVEIIRPLVSESPELKFVWVGDGEQRKILESKIHRYGIERSVILCGYRNDVVRLMTAADLLVVASRHEGGCSSVVREAMLHRLPMVTSDAGGIPEVVLDGEHGAMFPAGNTQRMLKCIRWALQNPKEMRAMADKARKRIEVFSTDRMVENYIAAFKKLHPQ